MSAKALLHESLQPDFADAALLIHNRELCEIDSDQKTLAIVLRFPAGETGSLSPGQRDWVYGLAKRRGKRNSG